MVVSRIKKIFFKLIPARVKMMMHKDALMILKKEQEFSTLSYAQEGEDIILNRFLENKKYGFYIDVGAHHPKRFSNTYLFYKKGWRGLNIDAMPGSMGNFITLRPEDINLEIGVSNTQGELKYHMFNEPALNTFSDEEASKKNGLRNYKLIGTKMIPTYPLSFILNKYLPENQVIDFMTIDVEGLDLIVLKSNDWHKYRPNLILVEDLNKLSLTNFFNESELYTYLKALDYEVIAKTLNTIFFKDRKPK